MSQNATLSWKWGPGEVMRLKWGPSGGPRSAVPGALPRRKGEDAEKAPRAQAGGTCERGGKAVCEPGPRPQEKSWRQFDFGLAASRAVRKKMCVIQVAQFVAFRRGRPSRSAQQPGPAAHGAARTGLSPRYVATRRGRNEN